MDMLRQSIGNMFKADGLVVFATPVDISYRIKPYIIQPRNTGSRGWTQQPLQFGHSRMMACEALEGMAELCCTHTHQKAKGSQHDHGKLIFEWPTLCKPHFENRLGWNQRGCYGKGTGALPSASCTSLLPLQPESAGKHLSEPVASGPAIG